MCVGFCMMVLLEQVPYLLTADSMALCVTPRNILTEMDWDFGGSASGFCRFGRIGLIQGLIVLNMYQVPRNH